MASAKKAWPFCQRCEENERGVICHPRLGLCHRCLFTMPDEEYEDIARDWEERGLIPRQEDR